LLSNIIDFDDELDQLGIPLAEAEVLSDDVNCTGECGPATYREKTWVGEMSEVIMEVWKRDTNGLAISIGRRTSGTAIIIRYNSNLSSSSIRGIGY
jgi:hypothetical protein